MISLILFNRPRELQTFYDIRKDSNPNPNPEIFSGLDFKRQIIITLFYIFSFKKGKVIT